MNIDRKTFLALLASPTVLSLLESCGGQGSGDGSRTDGFGFVGSSKARAMASPGGANDAARALNRLAADLYLGLAGSGERNLVFSPASIMIAMSMVRAGAVGKTGTEMDLVLHAGETGTNQAQLHRALNALTAALESRSGVVQVDNQDQEIELSITNSLWGQGTITWKTAFLDVLSSEYGAGMRIVDFAGKTEEARQAINRWVSNQTKERISELLGEGVLTPDIVLTLVNAVYLKAPWLVPFPEAETMEDSFTTVDDTRVSVPMMHTTAEMSYARGDRWQAIEIPYVGGALAMMLIVPDSGELADVESMLTKGLLEEVPTAYREASVTLGMPTFETETKVDLREVMATLGMPTAFTPGVADFSAMTSDEELFISFIVHQANITVDEKGTEAAAATAVGMGRSSAPVETVTLQIDRPFLFAIRDVPTGAVLFLGRVGDPR